MENFLDLLKQFQEAAEQLGMDKNTPTYCYGFTLSAEKDLEVAKKNLIEWVHVTWLAG